MKFLKGLFIVIVALVIIYFVVGLILPAKYSIAESIVINKPDSVVYKATADFNSFAKWNPWFEKEPAAKSEIKGAPGAIGSSIYWNGKQIGEGKMEILTIDRYKTITERLTFMQPYQSICTNDYAFEKQGNATKVTWSMTGEDKTIMERWMMTVFAGSVHNDFKKGLANLKKYCEAM